MKYFCLVLIGLGLTISGYLLWRHFVPADLSAPARSDFCSALFGTGCDDALRSRLAVQFGLPLAGWGLVYYGTLVSLLLLAETLDLDVGRFETHCHGKAGLARVQADIALGTRLGVNGTPAVFINGRRVYDLRPKTLLFLIAHALPIRAADQDAPEAEQGGY